MHQVANQTGRDKAVAKQMAAAERLLQRMPYAFQARAPGGDWVTLAKGKGADGLLMMMAGNRPEMERRILHVNTVHAYWAAEQEAS